MDRLPPKFIEHPRTVAEMEIGEMSYASVGAVSVDATGGCWIRLKARLLPGGLNRGRIQIHRQPDGYHLRIPRRTYSAEEPIPGHEVQAVSVELFD